VSGYIKLNKAFDSRGRTALMNAVVSGNVDNVKYILKLVGTQANELNQSRRSKAIDYCIVNFNAAIFECLIEAGAKIEQYTWDAIIVEDEYAFPYFTPERFISAVANNRYLLVWAFCDFIDQMIKLNAEPTEYYEIKNSRNRHALLLAARSGFDDIFEMLLQYGFDLRACDIHNHTLFYYLLEQRKLKLINRACLRLNGFNAKVTAEFQKFLPGYDYSSQGRREAIGQAITEEPASTYIGRIRLAKPIVEYRDERSFGTERTRQFLRQLSTQLFLYLASKKSPVLEIEAMFLFYKGANYLFITGNPIETFTTELTHLCVAGNLKAILIQGHLLTGKSEGAKEGRSRSLRYRKKLTQRIYEGNLPDVWPNNPDKHYANELRKMLRVGELKLLKRNTHDVLHPEHLETAEFRNKIIFISYDGTAIKPRCERLHAEEIFVDLLEQLDADPAMHSVVGGKKRPCAGCFGRMLQARVDEHGKHPGHFWARSMKFQSSDAAKTTAKVLTDRSAYESRNKAKTAALNEYDSGSNSE
jgi:hypothetical protein